MLSVLSAALPSAAAETSLPEVTVRGQAESADGPVQGYRATRSATFTKTDTPLNEVPASVSVVPSEMLKDSAMESLGDVFRYVPGVLMHQGEGNRDQLVIRGNSTTADFFVDGIRDDAQVFRDPYNLERVEILKGPGGMAFGRGGAGGVVNRITKRPVFNHVGEANLTYGSHNQIRGTIDYGGKLNDSSAWRINAVGESSDSYRTGSDLRRYAINPAATFSLSEQTILTVGIEHADDQRTADRGVPSFNGSPFNADSGTFFGNATQSHARATVNGAYATVEHDFGGGLQLRNNTRITHYDKFYQNVYPGSAVNTAGSMALSAYNNANQRTNIFNQTDFTRTIDTGALRHTLLFGMEVGRQSSINRRNTGFFGAATSITVAADNPIAVATRFAPNGTDADNTVQSGTFAVYTQDQIVLSQQWKVLAGLRYDRYGVSFDDRRTLVPAVDLARTDRAFSPRAGLIWTPDTSSTYYASYSYAFLPSGEQLSLAPTTSDLAPEKSTNNEIGARWDLLPKLTLSAALFRTDRLDVRVADPANPGSFIKSGQQRTDGMEAGLQGEISRTWQVYAALGHQNGRIMKPITSGTTAPGTTTPAGNRIALVPANTLSIWNKFEHGNGWGSGLGVIYQSGSFTSFNNTVRLPPFTRTDGALYYTLADGKTRLALNVENLFNRTYFPTADGDNNISTGAPRNARLTLSFPL